MTLNKPVKQMVCGMCMLMISLATQAAPATGSGTFFIANGKSHVNPEVIRSGKNRNGQIEFIGYAVFDLSGFAAEKLQKKGISISGNLKIYSGKPTELSVEYLGSFGSGELNVKSGAAWSATPVVVQKALVPTGPSFGAKMTLPTNAVANRFAVFRFKNEMKNSQWDLSALELSFSDEAAVRTLPNPIVSSEVLSDTATLYRKMIPAEKKLDPEWLVSLTERGHELDAAIRGSKADDSLKYIGMPVGGIACGTVVMDGSGQLYAWDIFGGQPKGLINQNVKLPDGYLGFKNGLRKTIRIHDGANYMNPPTVEKFPPSVTQGFSMRVAGGSEFGIGPADWQTVEFEGQWPVGNVTYKDSKSPISIQLEAYSPFIPLHVEDSKLPVTIMSFTLTNGSSKPVSVEFDGWLGLPGKRAQLHAESFDTTATGFSLTVPKAGKRRGGSMGFTVVGDAKAFKKEGINGLRVSATLAPGESKTIPFLISWNFGHHAYAFKFKSAVDVSRYAVDHFKALSSQTERWVETWNDTSLPQWFMDRSMAPASTMQTANLQYAGERFWAWEGIGAGKGTCTHVWAYAQAMARLFPSLERNLREITDFGKYQLPDGGVPFRPSKSKQVAIDGQCGTVLRSYREHLISMDDQFLKRNWPAIKKAVNYLIEFDKNDDAYDGLLDGEQHNTLDAEWYGKVHVLCSLYLAALRAGEEMAIDMGDQKFQKLCHDTYAMGSKNIEKLYNGEYYVQIEDPNHAAAIGVGPGVYIDQVYGQFWANQVGLGRLYNQEHIRSALNAIWKYNYLTDVGPFREVFRPGRFYAWKGDGGVLMCTWPNGGLREDFQTHWQYGYFNEIMSGFEHQLAANMIAERDPELLTKGLAIMRTVHDRYAPEKRNPYNEIEFSDFYARAMASYGSFLAACGFEYNGPAGMIGFDPVIHPENFRAPFTAAEGWGTFSQTIGTDGLKAELRVNWGSLKLESLRLNPRNVLVKQVDVTLGGKSVNATLVQHEKGISVKLDARVSIAAGQTMTVVLRY
ncbi:MAG: GH116 family glycosyl hydrolase [Pontiella sp.]